MNVAQLSVDALERFGEYNSTYFEGCWYSNFQLMERYCKLAALLQNSGVKAGDRVVVIMASCLEVPAAFHALARIGAVIIPVMPQLIAREISYIVENSGAHTVITSPDLAPRIVEATRSIRGFRQILVAGETTLPGCENFLASLAQTDSMQSLLDRGERDLAVLVYTSGTTGNPKGVMISHGNLIDNARAVAKVFSWPRDQRSMWVLPMSHVYGILLMNLGAVLGGVNTILRKFDAEKVLQTIEEFKVERCSLVPTMMVGLIHHPEREKYDVSSLKKVTGGSAPLSEEVRRQFATLFDCRVVDGYGQSEATCAVSVYRDDEDYVCGSAGRAIPGFEVCVQDDDNRPLATGQTGELCFRGPSVMLGYWKDEAATDKAIVDGWLHSGDIGHVDERGYIYITDRKKDMIIKGGENISPREIEEVLYQLPGIAEVAVYGVPDPTFQEEIAVSMVLKRDARLTVEEVREFASQQLTKFKIPKFVLFSEQLPKNSNGKVLKRSLREEWLQSSISGVVDA